MAEKLWLKNSEWDKYPTAASALPRQMTIAPKDGNAIGMGLKHTVSSSD